MGRTDSAVIIGGSRGIGRCFALEGARRRINVTAVARRFDPDDAELLEAVTPVHADVSNAAGRDYLRRERVWHQPFAFWVAGAYARGPVQDLRDEDTLATLAMHQTEMIRFLQAKHVCHLRLIDDRRAGAAQLAPFTFVAMGSISSYRHRKHEAVYSAAKAGQAAFLRNYAAELVEELPGSRVVLVNCARLGSEPGEQKLDAGGKRIDPGFVAKLVWGLIDGDGRMIDRPFTQINIERTSDKPILSYGPQLPEIP